MRAIVQDRYGPPAEVLRLREIETPAVGDGEVLVRVRASCVHPDVWHEVTGRPWVLRLMGGGFSRPKNPVPGTDVAGVVEAVGKGVTEFGPGDAVFGETYAELVWRNGGAFAEYVSVPEDTLARKPAAVSFEAAAAVPAAGFIALVNLRGSARLEAGKSVLVNGAGGGVGSTAVQLAKAYGARVTGVDHGAKLEMIRSLGADHVIDYTREDFTRRGERYDLILDVASNLSLRACRSSLTPEGVYLVIGHDHFGQAKGRVLGSVPRMLGLLALSRFVRHLPTSQGEPAPTKKAAMELLAELLAAGKLTPVIDRTYPLDQVPEAMLYLESGHACGRILVVP
ncbi:MAG: NAD(P)-dependent alcohol dehydrogenase [Acidobacteriota bacterium]|nr:NAD(P)-dependent alcohol dehydrogenase [Acidobacteriota bacterium]